MKLLSKQEIVDAQDLKHEIVNVAEWGGSVRVQVMNGTNRDLYEVGMLTRTEGKSETNLHDMRARLCAMTIADENGTLLFTEAEISELGKKSSVALDRVYEVAARLNGLGKEAAAAVDAAEKNSGAAPSGNSTSGSL